MLNLRPAFDAADRRELIRQITHADPTPIRRLMPTLSRDLATIVETATAPDPARRYPTAAALADDLGRWLDGEPIRARRPTAPIRLARWARRKLATAAVALLARRRAVSARSDDGSATFHVAIRRNFSGIYATAARR